MGRTKIILTEEEIEQVAQLREQKIKTTDIAEQLGYSRSVIERTIQENGLTRVKGVELSWKDKVDIETMVMAKINQKDIAKHYNISVHSLQRVMKKLDISTKRYTVNHDYFSGIDTEDKAYFLGFMYADGYNASNRNQIKLKLKTEDKYILEKFAGYLTTGQTPPIYKEKGSDTCSLQISSKQLCQDLEKWGCGKAKAHTLVFPKFLLNKPNLMRHFIRGYFDGDGTIFKKKRPKTGKEYWCAGFAGNENFIKALAIYLNSVTNSLGTATPKADSNINPKSTTWHIHYTKYQAINWLRDYLYMSTDDTFRLDRKYNRFPSLNEIVELETERLQVKRKALEKQLKVEIEDPKLGIAYIMEGTYSQIAEELNVNKDTLRSAIKYGSKLAKKYFVKEVA